MRGVSVLPATRTSFAVAVFVMAAVFAAAACASSPSAQARACSARSHLQTSVGQLRAFDYTSGSASDLAADLDSARKGLVGLEAAAHVPQNSGLQTLGGVGRIRQLEAEVRSLASQVQGSGGNGGSAQLASFENAVRQRTAEISQVAGAVTGC
jgi:hypothetical protein